MNDIERQDWINNDESLYLWWLASTQGITTLIRENRKMLTEYINQVLNKEPKS